MVEERPFDVDLIPANLRVCMVSISRSVICISRNKATDANTKALSRLAALLRVRRNICCARLAIARTNDVAVLLRLLQVHVMLTPLRGLCFVDRTQAIVVL